MQTFSALLALCAGHRWSPHTKVSDAETGSKIWTNGALWLIFWDGFWAFFAVPESPNGLRLDIIRRPRPKVSRCDRLNIMMTSSNANIFRVTGPMWGEFTGHRWIPLTKARDAELWCFLWSAPWINGSVNNGEAGDLRRHHAHYDVIMYNVIWITQHVTVYFIASVHRWCGPLARRLYRRGWFFLFCSTV